MPVVKVGTHNEVIIPQDVCEQLGVKPGDLVQVTFQPVADVPYTDEPLGPEAAASIEAGLKDIESGRVGPPLRTKEELHDYLDNLKKQ